jgi:hypothetical protein
VRGKGSACQPKTSGLPTPLLVQQAMIDSSARRFN